MVLAGRLTRDAESQKFSVVPTSCELPPFGRFRCPVWEPMSNRTAKSSARAGVGWGAGNHSDLSGGDFELYHGLHSVRGL